MTAQPLDRGKARWHIDLGRCDTQHDLAACVDLVLARAEQRQATTKPQLLNGRPSCRERIHPRIVLAFGRNNELNPQHPGPLEGPEAPIGAGTRPRSGRGCASLGGVDDDDLLAEQVAYYRARAPEYDEVYDHPEAPTTFAGRVLPFVRGDVLELACGTGQWTALLAEHADTLTAVDVAAEALQIARERSPATVRFVQADLFGWQPDRTYDTVFFGFWLSHVPRPQWPAFWDMVRRALRPGGNAVVVDQHTVTLLDETAVDPQRDVVRRTLNDGRHFDIVRVPMTASSLATDLEALGWHAQTETLSDRFLSAFATPIN